MELFLKQIIHTNNGDLYGLDGIGRVWRRGTTEKWKLVSMEVEHSDEKIDGYKEESCSD